MTITAAQYEQMKERVAKPRRLPAPVASAQTTVGASHLHEVILGVDPSLRGTGYGIIRLARTRPELLVAGTIACPSAWERSRCLVRISAELRDLLKRFHPTACAMEGVFYAQNLQTAIIMGEARGAALAAVAEAGLEIFEIAPRKVKQAMVGYGAAQKLAVAKMVQRMLQLPEVPAPDAADALALALTHAQEQRRHGLLQPRRL